MLTVNEHHSFSIMFRLSFTDPTSDKLSPTHSNPPANLFREYNAFTHWIVLVHKRIKFTVFSQNQAAFFKIAEPNTRIVYIHLNALFMVISNM